jgi:hypothetical protein
VRWGRRSAFILAVSTAVLSLLDSSIVEAFGPSRAAENCAPPDIALSYGREVNLEVALPPQTCVDPVEAGTIAVGVVFHRRALASSSESVSLFEFHRREAAEECDPRMRCELRMVMPHPAIEVRADYRVVIQWRSTGPGPGLLWGNDAVEMHCSFGTVVAAICTGV